MLVSLLLNFPLPTQLPLGLATLQLDGPYEWVLGTVLTVILVGYRVLYKGMQHALDISGEDMVKERVLCFLKNLALGLCDSLIGYWWVILQLAIEMSKVHIKRVTTEIDGILKMKEPPKDWNGSKGGWVTTIETPSLRLVRRILPALSEGFGGSLLCIVGALTGHVICLAYELHAHPAAMWLDADRAQEMYEDLVLVILLSSLPFALTWAAANVSWECGRLMKSLAELCHRFEGSWHQFEGSWHKEQEKIVSLHAALAMANGGAGPGFFIPFISVKLSFTALLVFMSALTGFLLDGVPLLMGETAENDYQVGVDARCPFGWSAVEGKCVKLFGAEGDGHELKTWDDAEHACNQYGGHLMSITSQEQQDAAAALLRVSGIPRTQGVWIGIRREGTADKLSWIDNSTMEMEHWAANEPDDAAEGDPCFDESFPVDAGFTFEATRDNCGFMSQDQNSAWWDGPCAITHFKPDMNPTLTEKDACYHARWPFICSKQNLPSEYLNLCKQFLRSESRLPSATRTSTNGSFGI